MKLSAICLSLLMSLVSNATANDSKLWNYIVRSGAAVGACTGTFCAAKLTDVQCGVYEASNNTNACSTGRKVFATGNSVRAIMNLLVAAGAKLNSDPEGDGQYIFAKTVVCTTEGKAGSEICWTE
jgi:hypothetical protein